jgi:hypothetical protein
MPHRGRLKWLVPIVIASACIAAPILYYFLAAGPGPEPNAEPPSQLASIKQARDAPQPIGREASGPIGHRDDDSGTSVVPPTSFWPAKATPAEPPSASASLKLPLEHPAGVGTPIVSKPVLEPEEIAALVKQGEQLVATGDLVTARTAFQRAAEAGNAPAAIALGATFDPIVLAKLGVVGMASDVDEARRWYQRAESMGSAEATRRLQILAKR